MKCTVFEWAGFTWVVRLRDGAVEYRDRAHWGGPWTNVVDTIKNSSVNLTFRRRLAKAERQLLEEVSRG